MDLRVRVALAGITLLLGCEAPPVTEPEDLGPCGATWGPTPSAGRIYVDPAAPAGGDGSLASPFDSLDSPGGVVDSALEAARATGVRAIAIGSGALPTALRLSEGEFGDSGLQIVGCGRSTTELTGQVGAAGVLQPIIDVTGPETADIVIRDLTVSAGRRNVVVRDGAGLAGPIVVQRVDVLDALRVGVLIDGDATVVALTEVLIEGVSPDEGALGWGLAVQAGASAGDAIAAPTILDAVQVIGATQVGVLIDGGWIQAIDLAVTDTLASGGELGRGLQLQNRCRATLEGITATANRDAAVYLHKPGRGSEPVSLISSILSATQAGVLPDTSPTGDGLVISVDGAQQPPGDFLVVVDAVEFASNPRSHVLVEGVTLEVGTNSVFGMGTTFPIAAQGGAVVQGPGGGPPGVTPTELPPGSELGVLSAPLALDQANR